MSLPQAAAVLKVSPLASREDVKAAFRRRARETHPDVTKGDDTEFKRVAEANEVFEKHFERQARGSGPEEGSLLGRKLRASREHVQRRVDRPYYGGEVNWPSLSPRWEETKNSAVIGLRSDGQVDLLVNNTYITTLSSLLGVVEHLKEIINAQPGAGPTSWEGYIVYLARQSTGEITPVGLLRLWERVMFEEGGTLHAPDLRKATRSTPDDFS